MVLIKKIMGLPPIDSYSYGSVCFAAHKEDWS